MARKAKEEPRPRRKKGTGAVYQRKSDGRWAAEWYVDGVRYILYADTYAEADKAVLREIAKVEQGTFIPPDRITVGEWLYEWYDNTKSATYRANPRYKRKNTIDSRLVPAVGRIGLQKLTARQLQSVVAEWAKEGLAPRTVRAYIGLLSLALDSAVKVGIIKENPCKAVELPKVVKPKRPALTLDQAQLFMIEINDHWLLPWVVIAVGTGMRVGELASLRWEDIDFEAELLHVRRNVAHTPEGYEEGPPKTEAGIRDIPLPDFVMDALIEQKRVHIAKKGEYGLGWNKDGLVLPHDKRGTYRNANVVTVALKRKLETAGLPVIPFHCLRHSAVRIMQVLKVPLEVIQQRVGHSSIAITADIYGEVNIEMQRDASKRINEAFQQREKRAK